MADQCSRFCQKRGVSLLIGSEFFGVNLEEANSICLPDNGGVLKHDPEHLQNCASWSGAFRLIEIATASFIERKYVFDAVRMKYMAVVQISNQVKNLWVGMGQSRFCKYCLKQCI